MKCISTKYIHFPEIRTGYLHCFYQEIIEQYEEGCRSAPLFTLHISTMITSIGQIVG